MTPKTVVKQHRLAMALQVLLVSTSQCPLGSGFTHCVTGLASRMTLVSALRRQNGQSIMSGWSPSRWRGVTVRKCVGAMVMDMVSTLGVYGRGLWLRLGLTAGCCWPTLEGCAGLGPMTTSGRQCPDRGSFSAYSPTG
jgi:hypothetical protein